MKKLVLVVALAGSMAGAIVMPLGASAAPISGSGTQGQNGIAKLCAALKAHNKTNSAFYKSFCR